MSAGKFTRTKYEDDKGAIHPIRVQPETLTAFANAAPAGPTNSDISAIVSLTKRQKGLKPRYITFKFSGAVPDGYDNTGVILRIPILTKAIFDGLTKGGTGNYLGSPVEIIGKFGEQAS